MRQAENAYGISFVERLLGSRPKSWI